jgi:hypothetical protein
MIIMLVLKGLSSDLSRSTVVPCTLDMSLEGREIGLFVVRF